MLEAVYCRKLQETQIHVPITTNPIVSFLPGYQVTTKAKEDILRHSSKSP